MIDYNFMITFYGEHFRHEAVLTVPEAKGAVAVFKKSERNARTAYFEPVGNAGMAAFLKGAKQHIREIWRANALTRLQAFADAQAQTLGENRLKELQSAEALGEEAGRLALRAKETGLYEDLKNAVALIGWDAKPKKLFKVHLYGDTKKLLGLLGIDGRIFHINIGYQHQCDFEMNEEIMALIADMGLALTFSCYEQEMA